MNNKQISKKRNRDSKTQKKKDKVKTYYVGKMTN